MLINEGKLSALVIDAINTNTESDSTEFKDARSGIPSDLWKPITAFVNSPSGGLIIFGVSESKDRKLSIVGNLDLAILQEKIVALMEQKIVNKAEYLLKVFGCKGKRLLALSLAETPRENKPCYYKEFGIDKGAYVRIGNTNRQITEEELRSFLRYTSAYNFDRKVVQDININALSRKKIDGFLERSAKRKGRAFSHNIDINQTLKNIGIIAEYDETRLPTIAGTMIFFSNIPQDIEQLSRYIIRCVRYSGNLPATRIIDTLDVYGTLDIQVDEALKFILRNIKTQADIIGSKRVEQTEYPEIALREIIVNSVVHRDYSNRGTYIQIAIFADRIEVSNPGTLPPGVTIENLKISQFSRNDVIAKVMRDLDYMEEFGRGIDLVYSSMSDLNLPEPLFKNVSNMFKVTLLGKRFNSFNERQLKIWGLIQDRIQITANLLHKLLSPVSRATVNNDLKKMVDLKLIEPKGTSNNTYYEIKG